MRLLFFIVNFFFFSFFLNAQITFQKTYGGTGNEHGYSVKQTIDGYIISGKTSGFGAGSDDVYLVKTSLSGSMQWTKTYGGSAGDFAHSIQQTNDGGYIIAGESFSFGQGTENVYLIKTSSNGTLQWSKALGGTKSDIGSSICQTTDGGYFIAGNTWSYGNGFENAYLIKTASDGTLQWTKIFGGTSGGNEIYATQQTNDGGYIILGVTPFGVGNNFDIYLVKTSSDGSLQWSKTYGGTGGESAQSIQQTNDGGYIIVGGTDSFGAGYTNVYLLKTASDGSLQWSKTYGGTNHNEGNSVIQTNDGGYVIAGYTDSFGSGSIDVYVIKTASDGSLQWSKTYGGTDYDYGYSVQQTNDGGFIISGNTNSFGVGGDIYLIKTDSNGNSGCNETNPNTIVTTPATIVTNPATQVSSGGVEGNPATQTGSGGVETTLCSTAGVNDLQNEKTEIIVFPNPFNTSATVSINGQLQKNNAKFIMYDVFGREVKKLSIVNFPFTIQRSNLPSGIYFYKAILEEGKFATGKIIIQ